MKGCYPCVRSSQRLLLVALFLWLMLVAIFLYNENVSLKAKITNLERLKHASRVLLNKVPEENSKLRARSKPEGNTRNKPIPKQKQIEIFAAEKLTIIVHDKGGLLSPNSQLDRLRVMFAKSTFLWNDDKDSNLAVTLNRLIPKVKTKYFLFIEPNVIPSNRPQEDVTLLYGCFGKIP